MRKPLVKAFAAAAVAAFAVVLSSFAAFAGTTLFNVSDINTFSANTDIVFNNDIENTYHIQWSSGDAGSIADVEVAEGSQTDGYNFTKRIYPSGGNRSLKIDLPADATVDFYVSASDSKDGSKSVSFSLTGSSSGTVELTDIIATTSGKFVNHVQFKVDTADTYTFAPSGQRLILFGVAVTVNDGPTVYWPTAAPEGTSTSSYIGGTTSTWVYNDDGLNNFPEDLGLDAGTTEENAVLTGSDGRKGSFEDAVFSDGSNTVEGKKGLNIYVQTNKLLTFEPKVSGTMQFYVLRTSDSTAEFRTYEYVESTRTLIGTYNGYGRDSENVKPISLSVEEGHKYELYANNGNSALFAVKFISADAVNASTPVVTLEEPTVTDGKIVITGNFNAFSKDFYSVNKIILNAATAKTTSQDDAEWTEFTITDVKDNGDGTFTFIAKLKLPDVDARYQAAIDYAGADDLTSNVNVEGVASNLVKFTASAS